jgi:hypothetical protein
MGSNPVNLTLRFLLELAALAALSIWGWHQGGGIVKYFLAIGMPLVAAFMWGIFAVPDDPSRSEKAPVVVPGYFRLLIELFIFGVAIWALFNLGKIKISLIFGILVLIHYLVSYDRIFWLMKQRRMK